MQIIPEPPWLLGWVTAVLFLLSSCELMAATATPLTTCVLLLWCRHLFCEPSSLMWLMQMPPHPSYFPTHSFVVNSCVSSLFLALTQGCRAITGTFLLLHSTFQQRFQVGSNSNNTCGFQSVKSDTVHVYMHVHDKIKPSPAWIFYNAKKSKKAAALPELSTVLQVFYFFCCGLWENAFWAPWHFSAIPHAAIWEISALTERWHFMDFF